MFDGGASPAAAAQAVSGAVSYTHLPGFEVPIDPPSSILAGEAFLARIYNAVREAPATTGSNVFNTTLFIGWDEPGGTYDHVPPGPVPSPDPLSTRGELGFRFDRSGYRVPALSLIHIYRSQATVRSLR